MFRLLTTEPLLAALLLFWSLAAGFYGLNPNASKLPIFIWALSHLAAHYANIIGSLRWAATSMVAQLQFPLLACTGCLCVYMYVCVCVYLCT